MTRTATKKKLTWDTLVRAEPRLADLLEYARAQERTLFAYREDGEIHLSGYKSLDCYRNVIRPGVERLVGWHRRRGPAFLETSDAYSLAIDTNYGALPDDFTDDEIDEAWERAYEADLEEGESIQVAGPGVD